MYKSSIEILKHIEKETSFILKVSNQKTYDEFFKDETLTRAISRALEMIGEASKKTTAEFRSLYPEIQWKKIARMRDKLRHHYEGIDYVIVWTTIVDDIPKLHFSNYGNLKNHTDHSK